MVGHPNRCRGKCLGPFSELSLPNIIFARHIFLQLSAFILPPWFLRDVREDALGAAKIEGAEEQRKDGDVGHRKSGWQIEIGGWELGRLRTETEVHSLAYRQLLKNSRLSPMSSAVLASQIRSNRRGSSPIETVCWSPTMTPPWWRLSRRNSE